MKPLFLVPLLLGATSVALAQPATTTKPAAKPVLEKVGVGELRLDGKITAILGDGVWQLDAISWTSPTGKLTQFDELKSKMVQLAPGAFIHALGDRAPVALKDVKLKSNVAVIGRNKGDGTVSVREVILLEGYGEQKTVGTLSINPRSSQLINESRKAREQGNLPKALQLAQSGASFASAQGDLSGEALCTQDMALLYAELKQADKSMEAFRRGQSLGERLGNPLPQVLGLNGQASLLSDAGKFNEAVALLERASVLSGRTSTDLQISVLGQLANTYLIAKKRAEAIGAFKRVFALEEGNGQRDDATETLLSLARFQAKSDPASAKAALDQVKERFQYVREENRMRLTIGLALALRANGDNAGAQAQIETVAKSLEERGDSEGATKIRAMLTNEEDKEEAAPANNAE